MFGRCELCGRRAVHRVCRGCVPVESRRPRVEDLDDAAAVTARDHVLGDVDARLPVLSSELWAARKGDV